MKKVKIKAITELTQPNFIKTELIEYSRDGGESKYWEKITTHDTVHILAKNTDTDKYLLVEQVRIPVLKNLPETDGITLEACAGIIDCHFEKSNKDNQALHVAKDEIREELGYDISLSKIKKIDRLISSTGLSGSTQHLYYCEVNNSEFVGQSLGLDEDIEVVEFTYEELVRFLVFEDNTDVVTKFLIMHELAIIDV